MNLITMNKVNTKRQWEAEFDYVICKMKQPTY